jgi:hypothetical protein
MSPRAWEPWRKLPSSHGAPHPVSSEARHTPGLRAVDPIEVPALWNNLLFAKNLVVVSLGRAQACAPSTWLSGAIPEPAARGAALRWLRHAAGEARRPKMREREWMLSGQEPQESNVSFAQTADCRIAVSQKRPVERSHSLRYPAGAGAGGGAHPVSPPGQGDALHWPPAHLRARFRQRAGAVKGEPARELVWPCDLRITENLAVQRENRAKHLCSPHRCVTTS